MGLSTYLYVPPRFKLYGCITPYPFGWPRKKGQPKALFCIDSVDRKLWQLYEIVRWGAKGGCRNRKKAEASWRASCRCTRSVFTSLHSRLCKCVRTFVCSSEWPGRRLPQVKGIRGFSGLILCSFSFFFALQVSDTLSSLRPRIDNYIAGGKGEPQITTAYDSAPLLQYCMGGGGGANKNLP